ncbi:MAG TPA: endonuclease/exonuclease/phosphatase family protein, partial [Campylobacterales bacterium]|nr:endonuclease/exonuclease/phosphatase family protein [Campylobacterales bacterium]
YNVENLFDMSYSGTEYEEYIPNAHNWTKSILNKKLTNTSEVICDIDADIIGLQEVENRNALKLLQKSLKKYGCIYKYSAITHKPKSAIQIALLSKIPIQNSKDIIVTRAWGIRNILETKFIIDGKPIYIFVNHWNSKQSPDSKRIKSALALKKRLMSLPKNSEYILLGDFNANYNENNIFHTLNTIRECAMRPNIFANYNLWLEEPIYRRWSHNFYGNKQGLDAIFIPYSLLDGIGIDYINNSFKVLKKHYLFHKKGYILRWKYKKGKHKGVGYSDHLPIYARFATKPYIKYNCQIHLSSIKELHNRDIELPILLQKVKVTSKQKNRVTIQQGKDIIYIYGIDNLMLLNKIYDIIVYKRKLYQNRYEIVDFDIKKSYDTAKNRSRE